MASKLCTHLQIALLQRVDGLELCSVGVKVVEGVVLDGHVGLSISRDCPLVSELNIHFMGL